MTHTDFIAEDAKARKDIVHNTDRSLFVEAGAGSGKTHQLVERLITLIVDDGVSIDRIAAITFTEAAAAELTARLRRSLSTIQLTGELPNGFLDPRTFGDITLAQDRATKALEGLPGAAIGTLHSFCLLLLKQFPFEAGLPPKVEKTNELQVGVGHVSAAEATLEFFDAILDEDPDAEAFLRELDCGVVPARLRECLELLLASGVKVQAIADVAQWMDQNWGDLRPTLHHPISVEKLTKTSLRELYTKLSAYNHQNYPAAGNKFVEAYVAPLLAEMDKVIASSEDELITNWDFESGADHRRGGKNPEVKAMKDCLKKTEQKIKELHNGRLVEATSYLRRVMAGIAVHNARQRVRSGRLEFHDMVFLAAELLANHEAVRQGLHDHFHAIFVDEFQDTDPVQLQIVTDIARGSSDNPSEGKLFTVGDPKQSIYKFRRADIESFMRAKTMLNDLAVARDPKGEAKAERKMHRNFRSSSSVVNWVNLTFGELFKQTSGATPQQASYEDMIPNDTDHPGRVVLVRSGDHSDGVDSATAKALEDADIVSLIKAAVDNPEEGWCHHAGKKAGEGFALEDIAILAPTHSIAKRIMAALTKNGIPYVSEGSQSLFGAEDITDFLVVLRAIADPADAFTQVAALRSLALAVSDTDLATHFTVAPLGHVDAQIKWISAQRDKLSQVPLSEFIRDIAEDLQLRQKVASNGRIVDLSRLDAFLIQADSFAKTTGLGLREFVNWAQDQAFNTQGASDPILDNSVPGVRILTVHKSKGREFPMVIMAGMTARANNALDRRGFLSVSAGTGLANFKLDPVETDNFTEFSGMDKLADKNEQTRLHYVAATRAKSVLAIPFECVLTDKGKAHGGQTSAPLFDVVNARDEFIDAAELKAPEDRTFAHVGLTDLPVEKLENSVANRELLMQRASQVAPRVAVTTIAHALDHSSEDIAAEKHAAGAQGETSRSVAAMQTGAKVRESLTPIAVPAGFEKGIHGNHSIIGGPAFGSAVHGVMELLDADSDVAQLAATVAPLHGVGKAQVKDIVLAVESLRATDAFARILDADEVMREVPVIAEIDGVAVDGVIDVLYKDGEDWVIADYKTDQFTKPEMIQSYLTQLNLYAGIVEQALGKKIDRLELIFVGEAEGTVVTYKK